MRYRVYISGPISDGGKATPDQRLANVARAAEIHADLIALEFAPICPQLTEYTERLTGRHFKHDEWMAVDFPWIEVAHVVLRMPGESLGSDLEVNYAARCSIPVVYSIVELEIWRARRESAV